MSRQEPVSRRDRPAKPALSRAAIIDAAMTLMQQEGAGKLTMRRLASALDTGPASLYVYVRNITELNALLIDRHLAGLDLRWGDDESARERLHRTLDDYIRLLASRPALAQAALVTWPEGPHYLDLLELLLRTLQGLGVGTETAGQAIDLLLQIATATAAEWSAHSSADGQDLSDLESTLASADPERHPLLVAAGMSAFIGGSPEARTAWAVDVLVNGLVHTDPTQRTGQAPDLT